jgi:hypothetical protein
MLINSMHCFVVLFVATAKILAVKAGTTIDQPYLPFWPTCLTLPACHVSLAALVSARH